MNIYIESLTEYLTYILRALPRTRTEKLVCITFVEKYLYSGEFIETSSETRADLISSAAPRNKFTMIWLETQILGVLGN